MTLTDAQAWLVLIGGAITLTTTAIVTIVNTVRMGRIQALAQTIDLKTETIEHNTNNKLGAQDRRIAEQDAEIAQLKMMRAEQERTRTELAMETARATTPPLGPIPLPLPITVVPDPTERETSS